MELRDELCPPAFDSQTVEALVELIEQIESAGYESKEQAELVAEFNRRAGVNYPPESFYEIEGAVNVDDFVKCALASPSPRLEIRDEEYLEIIRRLMSAEGSEVERHFWLNLLDANLVHPGVSDLIYWSDFETPEEVLEEARKYKPLLL